ncbi:MAG: transmembrane anchor protein [Proteobacteria bacterium]|nr:transmembrane anchor protein [Pseudomonadota bacterium]
MYNANKPNPEELPSAAQLLKSTVIAAIAAAVILVTIVLPAEFGIDPTRIGKILGLASMGEIKTQLAKEAEADRGKGLESKQGGGDRSSLMEGMFGLFVGSAHAQTPKPAWTDKVSVTLAPGKGAEIKLVMKKDAVAEFVWTVVGGRVNYDLHGDGARQSISYKKGRAVAGHEGSIKAKFTGNHGWFWRNRGKQDVTVVLLVRGAYSEVKRK